jgi:hypothetical protein
MKAPVHELSSFEGRYRGHLRMRSIVLAMHISVPELCQRRIMKRRSGAVESASRTKRLFSTRPRQ